MRRLVYLRVLILLLVSKLSLAQTTNYAPLNGTWTNQLTPPSTLVINVDQAGKITGTYSSPSGTTGEQFPLTGYANRISPVSQGPSGSPARKDTVTVVNFTVQWGKYGSITTWNGFYRVETQKIVCQWLLSRSVSDFKWDHILVGQDEFTKRP